MLLGDTRLSSRAATRACRDTLLAMSTVTSEDVLDRSPFARVLVVHTGKGGAKKTSLVTHLSGVVAAAGYRVLLIDLDRQGNCGEDLGYTDLADDGLGLRMALQSGSGLQPTLMARENLHVAAGGPELKGLTIRPGENPFDMLVPCLAPIVDQYDLVVLDTPPGGSSTIEMALGVARYLIIPSPPDRSSIKGLAFVADSVEEARVYNPALTLLGTVLVEVPTTATRIRAEALAGAGEVVGRPRSAIPYQHPLGSKDCRGRAPPRSPGSRISHAA